MIKTLHTNIDRYVRLQMQESNYREQSQKEHRLILDYCQKKDSEGAIALLKQHISAGGDQLIAYLKSAR
jgi:DNA-binding GntR family transcriptional regulator